MKLLASIFGNVRNLQLNGLTQMVQKFNQWIGTDGLKHIVVSSVLATLLKLFLPLWLAFLLTILVGIVKEVYDKLSHKGCAEIKDIVCDLIGAIIGIL